MSSFDGYDINTEYDKFASSVTDHPSPHTLTSPHSLGNTIKRFFGFSPESDYYHPPAPIEGKKTLILDLDETLIHSSDSPPEDNISYFMIGDPPFYVYKRPGLDDFLKMATSQFDTFIFTFGDKEYAEPLLDELCPFIDADHRLYRDSCETPSGNVKKDLSIFQRSKKDLILIDDSISAVELNPNNTIQIRRWLGNPNDKFLIKLLPPILEKCRIADDVRTVISKISIQKYRLNSQHPLPPHS